MLKAIIVEDEYLAREELNYLIHTYSDIEVIATFSDGLEAFKYLQSHTIDIAFLDINIPSIDGMLLGRNIHQFAHPPLIVFTTAYKEYAVDAFDLEAFDYLLKPLDEQRVQRLLTKIEAYATERPVNESKSQASTINLSRDNRIRVTPVEEIIYAEASEKVTEVHTAQGVYIAPYTISELMSKLPSQQFFRCHRSYCVNLSRIEEIIPWMNSTYLLNLHDENDQVPVSRGNIKAFRELMHL
ncbi:LytR/AlgR family response regulator transcription factor [Vibrio olivae]|uniref:LytR/AlgR family response regulator transcription factor n=1 Tax=Vibrio olivae TaxID=1243002 RepID=A0ABV5HRG6_9VIBR